MRQIDLFSKKNMLDYPSYGPEVILMIHIMTKCNNSYPLTSLMALPLIRG